MAKSSIFFLFLTRPVTGGDYVSMDHILGLNRLGFDAKAFCGSPEERRYFEVPIANGETRITSDDIVVVGENANNLLDPLYAIPCVKILHNQNPYYTFFGFDNVARLNAFAFRRVIVPSDFCAGILTDLGVTAPISRVRPGLPDFFVPSPKKLQIAYSPRKRGVEAVFFVEYFRAHSPEYAHLPWLPLAQMSREACAKVMAQSAIYAAFPMLESLGLMNLEAMASGCHVVGYTGIGGAEYARPANGDWIADGDHEAFASVLRQACLQFETGNRDPMIDAARATAAQFSRENFDAELENVWLSIMGDKADLYRK